MFMKLWLSVVVIGCDQNVFEINQEKTKIHI